MEVLQTSSSNTPSGLLEKLRIRGDQVCQHILIASGIDTIRIGVIPLHRRDIRGHVALQVRILRH